MTIDGSAPAAFAIAWKQNDGTWGPAAGTPKLNARTSLPLVTRSAAAKSST